jgi:hypothetical protein
MRRLVDSAIFLDDLPKGARVSSWPAPKDMDPEVYSEAIEARKKREKK